MRRRPDEMKPPWAEFENLDGVIYSQVTVRDEWLEVSGRRIPWPSIVGLRLHGYATPPRRRGSPPPSAASPRTSRRTSRDGWDGGPRWPWWPGRPAGPRWPPS